MMEHLVKPARRLITFMVVAMMMFAGLMAPAPISAQGQSIQSQLTGVTITYGPPYELQADGVYADEFMETMMFLGAADILAMGFMTPLLDINGARDMMLETLFGEMGTSATIDRGDYTGVSYSLDMLNFEGMEMGVFSLFMNQRSHGFAEFYIFIAPPALFGSTMQMAQNAFTINGSPLMDGVDALVMGNMITANIGITGGQAVTDVTEVQDQSGQQQTSQPDAQTTASTDTAARDEYLGAVSAEVQAVDASLVRMNGALGDMRDGVIDAQAARAIFDQEAVLLAGTNDRVSALTPPAGMESFHQEALAWSTAVAQVGVQWNNAVAGTGSQDAFSAALGNGIDAHLAFKERLQAEISASPAQDTQTTSRTTDTSANTQGSQTGTTDSSPSAYIEAVQTHRFEFMESFGAFNESLSLASENATDADRAAFREGTVAEAQNWLGYPSRAQQLTPPPGYESVHEAYITWAEDIATLGNLWFDFAEGGGEPAVTAFFDYIAVVQESDNNLQAELTAAGTGGTTGGDTGSGSTSTGSDTTGSSTTETTGTTRQTTRSTDSGGTDTSGNESETSGRTSRGSGTSSTTASGDSGETSSRTSRTSSDTDSRSTRTTRGSDSSTRSGSTAAGEWQGELNGVTITWGDDVGLSSTRGTTTESDAESGQDRIWLETTTPEGERIGFSLYVLPTNGRDATPVVSMLVNDPDSFHGTFGDDAVMVDSIVDPAASAALIRTSQGAGGMWVYVQVTCVTPTCDAVAMLMIEGEGYTVVDSLEIINESVAADGVSIGDAIPLADIEAAVDNMGN